MLFNTRTLELDCLELTVILLKFYIVILFLLVHASIIKYLTGLLMDLLSKLSIQITYRLLEAFWGSFMT